MICINIEPLKGNSIAPPLELNKEYSLIESIACGCGLKHYDVGLVSKVSYVNCHSCGESLDRGDEIHWCHPSRFKTN